MAPEEVSDGEPQKVAVIGLGSMGYGIAASLLRAGHRTWGFDVVPAQAERFRAEGGAPGDAGRRWPASSTRWWWWC